MNMNIFNDPTSGVEFNDASFFQVKEEPIIDLSGLEHTFTLPNVEDTEQSFDLTSMPNTSSSDNDWQVKLEMQSMPSSDNTNKISWKQLNTTTDQLNVASLEVAKFLQESAIRGPLSDDCDSVISSPMLSPEHSDNNLTPIFQSIPHPRQMKVTAVPINNNFDNNNNNNNNNNNKEKNKKLGKPRSKKKRKNSYRNNARGNSYAEAMANMELPEILRKPEHQLNESEKKEAKRQQRLLRNRVSAQLSRERKKQYVVNLESRLDDLQKENDTLKTQMEELKNINSELRDRLNNFEQNNNNNNNNINCKKNKMIDNSNNDGSFNCNDSDDATNTSNDESPMLMTFSNVLDAKSLETEIDTPAIKRRKLNAMNKKAGVVLFALVFSFGVFYHLANVTSTNRRNRFIRLPSDSNVSSEFANGRIMRRNNKKSSLSLVQDDKDDNNKSKNNEIHLLTAPHMRDLSTFLQEKVAELNILPHLASDADVNHNSIRELRNMPLIVNGNQSTKSVDAYNSHSTMIEDAMHSVHDLYKSMKSKKPNIGNNNDDESRVMFCPSIVTNQAHDAKKEMVVWIPSHSLVADYSEI